MSAATLKILKYLNAVKTELQGNGKLICDLIKSVSAFRRKMDGYFPKISIWPLCLAQHFAFAVPLVNQTIKKRVQDRRCNLLKLSLNITVFVINF